MTGASRLGFQLQYSTAARWPDDRPRHGKVLRAAVTVTAVVVRIAREAGELFGDDDDVAEGRVELGPVGGLSFGSGAVTTGAFAITCSVNSVGWKGLVSLA